MSLRSLRSKIFIFVLTILVLGAGLVMVFSQYDVTRTITQHENVAIDNVLELLAHDSTTRWENLLNEKVNATQQARQPLIEYCDLISATLLSFAAQAEQGLLSTEQAQAWALQWASSLRTKSSQQIMLLDAQQLVLADNKHKAQGQSLAQRRDIKGRALAEIARQEVNSSTHSFVIYRHQHPNGQSELRYAAFILLPIWNWTIVVSDSVQSMHDRFERFYATMQQAVEQTIAGVQLTGTGFIFILDEQHDRLHTLPAAQQALLYAKDQAGISLLDYLLALSPKQAQANFIFDPHTKQDESTSNYWLIKSTYVKGLNWRLVAAVSADELAQPATALRNRIGLLFLAGLIGSLLLAWLLSVRITRPLQQLRQFVRQLPEQDLNAPPAIPAYIQTLPHTLHDEVGELATTFIHMDALLRDKVRTLLQESASRERFESELSIARDIQMGLLPTPLPASVTQHVDLYATMLPAKQVGGDLYDYFMLPNGKLCIAIGDVSDKGVPAALFMAVTRTLIRACAEDVSDPARLMESVNNRLSSNNPNMMFVTLILAVLDLDTGQLLWANGGHPPLCVVDTQGRLQQLSGRSGPACGVQTDLSYQCFSTELALGATLFGYSDGIDEALNPDEQEYGNERLFRFLQSPAALSTTVEQAVQALLRDVQDYAQGHEQADDITLISLRRRPL